MLEGKTILVTGGTGQLGRAVCRELLLHGATVLTHFRREKKRRELLGFVGDLAQRRLQLDAVNPLSPEAAQEWVQSVLSGHDRIHGFVHTLGGIHPKQSVSRLSPEIWRSQFVLNLDSAFYMARALLPHFLQHRSGKLVFVSALGGLHGKAELAAYSAAKSGLIRLAEALAEETRDQNIQVNVVAPGILKTAENLSWGSEADAARWVPPERLAKVIAFLLSPASDDLTGVTIPVPGKM